MHGHGFPFEGETRGHSLLLVLNQSHDWIWIAPDLVKEQQRGVLGEIDRCAQHWRKLLHEGSRGVTLGRLVEGKRARKS